MAGSHPGPQPLLMPAGCCPLPDAFLGCAWHPPGSAAARTHLLSIITMQLKQGPQRTLSCPWASGWAQGRQIPPLAFGSQAVASGSDSAFRLQRGSGSHWKHFSCRIFNPIPLLPSGSCAGSGWTLWVTLNECSDASMGPPALHTPASLAAAPSTCPAPAP